MGIDWPTREPSKGRVDIVIGIRTPDGDVLTCVLGEADPLNLGDVAMEEAIKALVRMAGPSCAEWCGTGSSADHNGAWERDGIDFCTRGCADGRRCEPWCGTQDDGSRADVPCWVSDWNETPLLCYCTPACRDAAAPSRTTMVPGTTAARRAAPQRRS